MSFIGKRITELSEVPLLKETDCFIVDTGNTEANKITVANARNTIITPESVQGSTVEIQMAITNGKEEVASALQYQNVEASVTESFKELEDKVASLNVASGDDKKSIPWIFGRSIGNNSSTAYSDFGYFDSETNLSYKASANGIFTIGIWEADETGQISYRTLLTDTSGTWSTVGLGTNSNLNQYLKTTDGSILFIVDGTNSYENGWEFDFCKATYNKDLNTVSYTKYHFHIPEGYGTGGEYALLCVDDENRVWTMWYTAMRVFDLNTTTIIVGTGISFPSTHAVGYSTPVGVVVVNLTYRDNVLIYKISNGRIVLLKNLSVSGASNSRIDNWSFYDKDNACIVGIGNNFACAFVLDLNTLTIRMPTIINPGYFKNTNMESIVYSGLLEYPANLVNTYKLPDGKTLIITAAMLSNVCVFDYSTNTIEVVYYTGFGLFDGFLEAKGDGNIEGTMYTLVVIDPNTLNATVYCRGTIPSATTTYPVVRNASILLNEKNVIDYLGNKYALEKLND